MDKQSLRKNYQKACKILGFDVHECDKRLDSYKDLDDYRITIFDPIKSDPEASQAFLEAYRIYHFNPDEFTKVFE